jgi:hypothetical protein
MVMGWESGRRERQSLKFDVPETGNLKKTKGGNCLSQRHQARKEEEALS